MLAIEKAIADLRATISTLETVKGELNALLRQAKEEERERCSALADQLIDNWKESMRLAAKQYDASAQSVCEDGYVMAEELKEAIVNESAKLHLTIINPIPVNLNDRNDNDDINEPDDHGGDVELQALSISELAQVMVKLMGKAGTYKDGLSAIWRPEEIVSGLTHVMPSSQEDVDRELDMLYLEGVVKKQIIGKTNDIVYVLADDAFAVLGLHEINNVDVVEKLGSLIKSNKDVDGNYMPWTVNQIMFAVRGDMPSLTEQALHEIMADVPGCAWVDDHQYIYREKRPTKYPPGDLKQIILDMFVASSPKRAWRDYDIHGLLSSSVFADHEYMDAIKSIRKALSSLVDDGMVKHMQPSADRMWCKEDRWLLKR
jgi:hypothetical protein